MGPEQKPATPHTETASLQNPSYEYQQTLNQLRQVYPSLTPTEVRGIIALRAKLGVRQMEELGWTASEEQARREIQEMGERIQQATLIISQNYGWIQDPKYLDTLAGRVFGPNTAADVLREAKVSGAVSGGMQKVFDLYLEGLRYVAKNEQPSEKVVPPSGITYDYARLLGFLNPSLNIERSRIRPLLPKGIAREIPHANKPFTLYIEYPEGRDTEPTGFFIAYNKELKPHTDK